MLSAFSAPGRFFRGNLHTHSSLSDGALSPEEVCRRYEAMGYDFLCLSDHFMEKFAFPLADTRPYRTNRFTTILGAEVHAGKTKRGGIWHILAVGLPEDFPTTKPDESATDLATRCKQAGAFIAIAHPQWYGLMPDEAETLTAAHAVEIYNHTCNVHATRPDGTYLLDELLSRGKRLTAIATDDAHFNDTGLGAQDAFGGWVMVKAEENTPDALLTALKAGNFYASTGPELHNIEADGDTLLVQTSPATRILALGAGYRSISVAGPALTRAELDISTFSGDWLRLVIVDQSGKQAWSNPLWRD